MDVNPMGGAPDEAVLREVMDEADPAASAALTTRTPFALGAMVGDVSAQDIQYPRLQIAYGVGGLAERSFNPGDVVLDKEHLLVRKDEGLGIIVVATSVYWKEYVSSEQWNAGVKPRVYPTEEAVLAVGGTTQWVPGQPPPTFSRAMDMRLLIEKPKDCACSLFALDLAGQSYAPAQWSVDKTAYRKSAQPIVNALGLALKTRGLLAGRWELRTTMERVSGKPTIVPQMRLIGFNSDTTIAAIRELLGS